MCFCGRIIVDVGMTCGFIQNVACESRWFTQSLSLSGVLLFVFSNVLGASKKKVILSFALFINDHGLRYLETRKMVAVKRGELFCLSVQLHLTWTLGAHALE